MYGFDKLTVLYYAQAAASRKPIAGFDYSIEDMAKFGITNVKAVDGEWDWRSHNDTFNVIRVPVDR